MLLQEKSLRASSESNNCHVVSGSLKANTTGDFSPPPPPHRSKYLGSFLKRDLVKFNRNVTPALKCMTN